MHKEKLFAIVGCPLGHSLSPELHSWAFDEIGYPGIYMAFEQKPENLARFYDAVRTLPVSGGNITIPFKVDSMRYVDGVSERAKRIGAMNTFYWKDGRLLGENTDVTGFMAPLRGRKIDSALILGEGAFPGLPSSRFRNWACRTSALRTGRRKKPLPWQRNSAFRLSRTKSGPDAAAVW